MVCEKHQVVICVSLSCAAILLPSFKGNFENDNGIHPTMKHNHHVIISSVCVIYLVLKDHHHVCRCFEISDVSNFYVLLQNCIIEECIFYIFHCVCVCVCVYTGCPRRNVPDFGRVFLMLKYTDITQDTYIQI